MLKAIPAHLYSLAAAALDVYDDDDDVDHVDDEGTDTGTSAVYGV